MAKILTLLSAKTLEMPARIPVRPNRSPKVGHTGQSILGYNTETFFSSPTQPSTPFLDRKLMGQEERYLQ